MSKISRVGQEESYNVTADWLKDFAKKYARNAGSIPPAPPTVIASTEKFATVEEKLKDIMSRVGFTNIHNVKEGNLSSDTTKVAKKNNKKNKELNQKVNNILEYIKEIVVNEPDLPTIAVMKRCSSEDGLEFDALPLDVEALKGFVNKMKSGKSKKNKKVKYHKQEISASNQEDDVAEYWNHGIPSKK